MKSVRKEMVTVVHQTVVDGKVIAVTTHCSMRAVGRNVREGYEYVVVKGARIPLIKGVALSGGRSDPMAK